MACSQRAISEEDQASLAAQSDPQLKHITSHHELCSYMDGKLAGYVDLVYYVKGCKLRPMANSALINSLIQEQKKTLISIDESHYSQLEIGKLYTLEDYHLEFGLIKSAAQLCQQYEGDVVTSNNVDFYYIDHCRRRKFDGYDGVMSLNTKSPKPISTIPPVDLNHFKIGDPMPTQKITLVAPKPQSDREIRAHLPPSSTLCGQIKSHVVSFYQGIFLLENCTLRPIMDANLEVQEKAVHTYGSIQELTAQQRLGIPEAKPISSAEAIKKI